MKRGQDAGVRGQGTAPRRAPIVGDVIVYRTTAPKSRKVITFRAVVVDLGERAGDVHFAFAHGGSVYVVCNPIRQGTLSDAAKGAHGTWRWPKPGEVPVPFYKVLRRADGKGYTFKARKRRPA
ncbi:MAG: hypothetical protein KIS92_20055 [Planctomycetota bacterium]|nr:hypothetical protein [Planctomycetota bacterium]